MKFRSVLFATLLLLAANIVHAQLNGIDLSAIEAATPLSSDQVPAVGTFYSAQNPGAPPMPGNIFSLPCWSLGNGYFLLDDLDGSGGGGFHAMDDSAPIPGEGGGGDGGSDEEYTNNFSFTFPTNGLWLWITNISDGTVYANLNGATDYVYEIFSTTNLAVGPAATNWNIETEVFPGASTNTMPFSVSMNGRNPLFLWARDWTGITSNGNLTPDWWFYYWFGTINFEDSDQDPQGYTLYFDYQNSFDPNVLRFNLANTNRYFNSPSATIPVLVSGGTPFYEAVLVNDTNTVNGIFSDAVWVPYTSSNIVVNLGYTNGPYTVWIGLRGLPTNATPTWIGTELTLDTNEPVFVITNPVGSTVTQPIIQLQGLVSETLSSLTFDVSNALGTVTDQPGQWTPLVFDTNTLDFTTNSFQCYDVPLTNGLNVITLHAMDLAGNCSTTSVNLTLDYSGAVPPASSIVWPTNGTSISGANFTLQGQLDDDTAEVTAQIVDGNGDTNTVQGLVERSGLVWAQNLPLAAGTNNLTLMVTNAAGLSMMTNLTLVQSSVLVGMNPLNQFNQANVSVTGTISDPACTLTVNGTNAYYLDDEGDWEADNVPVNAIGTAIFNVQVFNDDFVQVGSQQFSQPQPPTVGLMSFSSHNSHQLTMIDLEYGDGPATSFYDQVINWNYLSGGKYSYVDELSSWWVWVATDYRDFYPVDVEDYYNVPAGAGAYSGSWADQSIFESGDSDELAGSSRYETHAELMIEPSGQVPIGQKVLCLLQAQVYSLYGPSIPPATVQIQGQTLVPDSLGSTWGDMLLVAPASANVGTTPSGVPENVGYNESVTVPTLQIVDNNTGNVLSGQVNTVIVGQQINLSCQLSVTNPVLMNSMISNVQWTIPGYAISNYVVATDTSSAYVAANFPTNNSNIQFYWVDGSSSRTVQCSATIAGATITGQAVFNVLKPMANVTTYTEYVTNIELGPWILFGQPDPIVHGITFSNTVTIPSGFTGSNEWVQVVLADIEEGGVKVFL